MPNVTVAFDERVKGWTSQYTFVPDSGLSLNNQFFTFSNGLMWQHNDPDSGRANFYGIAGNTSIQFVFNDNPTIVKNFKTLAFEGTENWEASVETNLETGGVPMFLNKEGKQFNWIRGTNNQFENLDFSQNAAAGIGQVLATTAGSDSTNPNEGRTVSFQRLPVGLSPGDVLYQVEPNNDNFTQTPALVGVVDDIMDNQTFTITGRGIPGIINDQLTPPLAQPVPGNLFIYIKDNQVDKSGIVGFYMVVTMTTTNNEEAEIFSVNTNTFQSQSW